MRYAGGYLVLGRWGGAPVRAHWTVPVGAIVFGHLRFEPGFWLGFFLVTLIHELGHALVVRRYRCRVVSIDVHGLGGSCQWSGPVTAIGRAYIAWGGVAAQFLALGFTAIALSVLGAPPTRFDAQLVGAFTGTNVFLILINLIPVPPLDGAEAWKLPGLLWRRNRRRARDRGQASIATELASLEAADREPIRPEAKAAVDDFFRKLADEKERVPRD
jgi:stage IV sporulation protein FB